MSRQNKVNPDRYTLAGRLTPDDLAREYRKQSDSGMGSGRARSRKARPPWMANNAATDNTGEQQGAGADPGEKDNDQPQREPSQDEGQEPQGKPRANAKGKAGSNAAANATGEQEGAAQKNQRRTMEPGSKTA